MTSPHRCPECGKELSASAPRGLCPACLLKRGLETNTGGYTAEDAARWKPPAVDELALRFPELEIVRLIGRGGMGAVYQARQKNLDRMVALKILPPEIGRDLAFAERFAREAQALARLNHPHIVAIYEFGERAGWYFFIMEFVDGLNLRGLLDTGHIATKEALAIVPQICEALQYAHDHGIVHRDIKPENILLSKTGQVKIADFGLAKLMGRTASSPSDRWPPTTDHSTIAGTPQYMAPEQVDHPAEVDHRADIYSLGVVFYQMLTGQLPPNPLTPPSTKVQIDVRLDEVVLRALEREPERRYQQVSEVKTQIETIITTPTPQSPPSSTARANVAPQAVPPPSPIYHRWHPRITLAGTRNGSRAVNWPGVFLGGITVLLFINAVSLLVGCIPLLFHSTIFFSPLEYLLNQAVAIAVVLSATIHSLLQPIERLPPLDSPSNPTPPQGGYDVPSPPEGPSPTSPADLTRARHAIFIPAIGLRIAAGLNLLIFLSYTFFSILHSLPGARRVISNMDIDPPVLLIFLILNFFIFQASIRMIRFQGYVAAISASILAMLALPGNLIGLPFGIWSLIILSRREIKDAFAASQVSPQPMKSDQPINKRIALSIVAFICACLSGFIPTIFYWLAPWLVPWLSPEGQQFMLWLTLVVAILAIIFGLAAGKTWHARTAIIIGGINLIIWLLFSIAGNFSKPHPHKVVAPTTAASPVSHPTPFLAVGLDQLLFLIALPILAYLAWRIFRAVNRTRSVSEDSSLMHPGGTPPAHVAITTFHNSPLATFLYWTARIAGTLWSLLFLTVLIINFTHFGSPLGTDADWPTIWELITMTIITAGFIVGWFSPLNAAAIVFIGWLLFHAPNGGIRFYLHADIAGLIACLFLFAPRRKSTPTRGAVIRAVSITAAYCVVILILFLLTPTQAGRPILLDNQIIGEWTAAVTFPPIIPQNSHDSSPSTYQITLEFRPDHTYVRYYHLFNNDAKTAELLAGKNEQGFWRIDGESVILSSHPSPELPYLNFAAGQLIQDTPVEQGTPIIRFYFNKMPPTSATGDFYISGPLDRPGVYACADYKTIKLALVAAGLRKPWPEKATLLRRPDDTHNETLLLNPKAILQGQAPDLSLKPNDILTIESSIITQPPPILPDSKILGQWNASQINGKNGEGNTIKSAVLSLSADHTYSMIGSILEAADTTTLVETGRWEFQKESLRLTVETAQVQPNPPMKASGEIRTLALQNGELFYQDNTDDGPLSITFQRAALITHPASTVSLLAIQRHTKTGLELWQPDGSPLPEKLRNSLIKLDDQPKALDANNEFNFLFLIKNPPDPSIMYKSFQLDDDTGWNSDTSIPAPDLGGTLIRIRKFQTDRDPLPATTHLRFGFAIHPWRTLLEWKVEGANPPTLTTNHWPLPGDPPQISIRAADFELNPNDHPCHGAEIRFPIPEQLQSSWPLDFIIHDKAKAQQTWLIAPVPTLDDPRSRWDFDIPPADIHSVTLRGLSYKDDYLWLDLKNLLLKPTPATQPAPAPTPPKP